VGAVLGEPEGKFVGAVLGEPDGETLGAALGPPDGDLDGKELGETLGEPDGLLDGVDEGADETQATLGTKSTTKEDNSSKSPTSDTFPWLLSLAK